jgi:hypothetical protein
MPSLEEPHTPRMLARLHSLRRRDPADGHWQLCIHPRLLLLENSFPCMARLPGLLSLIHPWPLGEGKGYNMHSLRAPIGGQWADSSLSVDNRQN